MRQAPGVSEPINLFDFRDLAATKLDQNALDYYRSGAHDELTLRDNRDAFDRIKLRYRVLVDVRERNTSATAFGETSSMPVWIAPTAFHKMAHPDGEVATARAAGSAGVPMILSTLSNTPVEEVVTAASGPVWFQLYVYRDREATRALVQRVEEAGARGLVLTVDAPLLGTRERDRRNGFRLPDGLAIANATAAKELPEERNESGLAAYFAAKLDPGLTFRDIEWLSSITKLPVVVKGVVRGDDAARCVEHGAKGIVVSNHGGRQLDTSIATIDALPDVVASVQDEVDVVLDGGIRRGTDVLKALARGAKAVLIGRPVLWGLAAQGQPGVERVLAILREEIDLALALTGSPTVAQVTPDLIA
ncbi:MAG: alpha-hydroxy acid oxidase [Myxococcota bacterium]